MDGRLAALAALALPLLFLGGVARAQEVSSPEKGAPTVQDAAPDLANEARGLRSFAEQMLDSASQYRANGGVSGAAPGLGGGPFLLEDLRALVRAASEFELAARRGSWDLEETRSAYATLRRAWARVNPYWADPTGNLAAADLERALARLDSLYEVAER